MGQEEAQGGKRAVNPVRFADLPILQGDVEIDSYKNPLFPQVELFESVNQSQSLPALAFGSFNNGLLFD